MNHDQEMTRALIADGEKLRAQTGEDHGPWDGDEDELPPTFLPEEPAEVAELRGQLATALRALVKCQKALAMLVSPDGIKQSTVINAFAQAMAAEAAAREIVGGRV